jgi:hypothetical protein
VRTDAAFHALQAARHREGTAAFAAAYAKRAGIEGTRSRGIRSRRLRQLRSIGLAKARLGHLLTAAALNCSRLPRMVRRQAACEDTPYAVHHREGRMTGSDVAGSIASAGEPVCPGRTCLRDYGGATVPQRVMLGGEGGEVAWGTLEPPRAVASCDNPNTSDASVRPCRK